MANYYSNWSTAGDVLARIYIEVSYTQDKVKRQSTVNTRLLVQFSTSSSGAYKYPTTVNKSSTTISGQTFSYSSSYSKDASNVFVLGSSSKTITHDSQGKASFSVSAKANWQEGQDGISGTLNIYQKTISLPDLPSVSTVSNNTEKTSPKEFGTAVTFNISRYSDIYKHDLSYAVAGTTYTIGTNIDTSQEYIFPIGLINQFTGTSVPTINVTCITKNSDTVIGATTTVVYLKVPDSYIPTVNLTISDVGSVPAAWGVYVKTKSKIKGVITADSSAGSTISLYEATANGQQFNTSTFETEVLKNVGENNITAKVTDSRGRTATTSKNINVVDYYTPTISAFSVKRCLEDGTLDEFGTYGKVVCTYSISPINNKNAKVLKVKYGDTIKTFELSSYSSSISETIPSFSGLDKDSSHNFEFYIIDSFETNGIKYTYTMPIASCLISKRAGGKGIAFGRVATEDKFVVDMITEFEKDANFLKITQNNKDVALKEDIKETKLEISSDAEIATNEYIDGKQVYVRRINCNNLPNSTVKHVYLNFNVNTINIERIFGAAYSSSANQHIPVPYVYGTERIAVALYNAQLDITSNIDASSYTGHIYIYYTKN